MSYFSGTIYSEELMLQTQLCVILPQDTVKYHSGALRGGNRNDRPPKTLILLHGLSSAASSWMRFTSIERYAEEYGIAVVMPEVQRSYYQDMKNGLRYFSYIANELPVLLNRMFHLSTAGEDVAVAGSSMGGYGALRCAFTYPEKFGTVGAFASGCDVYEHLKRSFAAGPNTVLAHDARGVFGETPVVEPESDLWLLAEKMKEKGNLPRIFLTSGASDYLYPYNKRFREMLAEKEIPFTYEEWPGIHEWRFWDESLVKLLAFCYPDIAK